MLGVRHLIAVTSFFCLVTNFAVRVNLNVAIIAMVNSSAVYSKANIATDDDLSCHSSSNSFNISNEEESFTKEGEFLWSPATQGIILGSFYYGYCCFQIVGGRLAEIYSGKWVLAVGTFLASILAMLTPIAARHSVTAMILIRVFQGVSQSVMIPSLYAIFGHWFPDFERGTLGAVVGSGISIGILAGMSITGFLCHSDLFYGWPSAFYSFGLLNLAMVIFWCLLITDCPMAHRWIAEEELKYIVSNQQSDMNNRAPPMPWLKVLTSVPFLALISTKVGSEYGIHVILNDLPTFFATVLHFNIEKVPSIPWRKVLTSVPFLALALTQCGSEWCIYIILNDLPTFFATVLHFDIEKNGVLSSIPFLLKAVIAIIVGFTSDAFLRKGYTTLNFTRKFCTVFPFVWFSVGLVGVCVAGCNAVLSTILFLCTVPIIGFTVSGYNINHLDLSPEYAGTLYGITNTFSSTMGFVAPMFVGYMTDKNAFLGGMFNFLPNNDIVREKTSQSQQSLQEWYTVFGTVIAVLLFSSVIFSIFGSTKKQNWIQTELEVKTIKEALKNYNTMGQNQKTSL